MIFYTKRVLNLGLAFCIIALPCSAQTTDDSSDTNETSAIVGYEAAFPALGTLVHLKAFSNDKERVGKAFGMVEQEVRRLESILTDYEPESETRRLTVEAFGRPTRVSEELWEVLLASDAWYTKTDGAFDSSLGALTQLWRKKRRVGGLPAADEIREALRHTGWQHVKLDRDAHTVELLREGIRFDFGAIGKGYIVDRSFQLLVAEGLTCCLVNISGNMRMGTPPSDREGWRIEISPLEKSGEPLRRIACANCAIATSGDLWQFVVIDGVRRSHILDPKTGVGVRGPVAATVIAPTATDADAFATAACVLDSATALDRAAETPGIEVLIATLATEVETVESPGFPAE